MLLGLLPEGRLVKDTTLDELADFMAWVGEALLEGVVPSRSYYNEPWPGHRASRADKNIAAPFVFAFAGLQSDNKQTVACHKFWGRKWACNFLCESCFASKSWRI